MTHPKIPLSSSSPSKLLEQFPPGSLCSSSFLCCFIRRSVRVSTIALYRRNRSPLSLPAEDTGNNCSKVFPILLHCQLLSLIYFAFIVLGGISYSLCGTHLLIQCSILLGLTFSFPIITFAKLFLYIGFVSFFRHPLISKLQNEAVLSFGF